MERNATKGSSYFPFRVNPFSKGLHVQESKQEVIKVDSFVKPVGQSSKCIQSPQNEIWDEDLHTDLITALCASVFQTYWENL